jgi:hypothetical protein
MAVTLYFDKMPPEWTHDDLQQFFFRFGMVLGSYVDDTDSDDSHPSGYVVYASLLEAYEAIAASRDVQVSLIDP